MGGHCGWGKRDDVIVFDTVNKKTEVKCAMSDAPTSETTFMSINNACATFRTNRVIALVSKVQYGSFVPSLIEYDMGKNSLSLIKSFR